jgi:hypothetical protein
MCDEYGESENDDVAHRTFDVSVFTKLCKSSREILAGKLTAGAKGEPSSSDTN